MKKKVSSREGRAVRTPYTLPRDRPLSYPYALEITDNLPRAHVTLMVSWRLNISVWHCMSGMPNGVKSASKHWLNPDRDS